MAEPTYIRKLLYDSHSEHLCEGLKKYRTSFTDITLVIDGVRIVAHKIILCAFSPYFGALCRSNMEEAKQDEIVINDLNGSIVADLVEFAYTGKLSYTPESVQDVLQTANFLGMKVVEQECACYIANRLSPDNCVDVYNIGLHLGEESLCEKAVKYITKSFSLFAQSAKFMDLPTDVLCLLLKADNIQFRDPEKVPIPANQEECILDAVMKYISHEEEKRLPELPRFLSSLYLNILLPSVLQSLKNHELVKKSPEALDIVNRAGIVKPITMKHRKKKDVVISNKPRNNKMLKKSWSENHGTIYSSSINVVTRYNDADYVPITSYVKSMKMFMRRWWDKQSTQQTVWGGYEVQFSNGHIAHHGGKDFNYEEYAFELAEGEVITSLEIDAAQMINCVTFITNNDRRLGPYGKPRSMTTIQHGGANELDGYLVGTKGTVIETEGGSKRKAIRSLRFLWAYVKKKSNKSPGEGSINDTSDDDLGSCTGFAEWSELSSESSDGHGMGISSESDVSSYIGSSEDLVHTEDEHDEEDSDSHYYFDY